MSYIRKFKNKKFLEKIICKIFNMKHYVTYPKILSCPEFLILFFDVAEYPNHNAGEQKIVNGVVYFFLTMFLENVNSIIQQFLGYALTEYVLV